MKKVITVGDGFIASHLPYEIAKYRFAADEDNIRDFFDTYTPNVVVNCMGYCGQRNIDDCELNKERTLLSNTVIPTLLAIECQKRNIQFINISSGCVFYGQSPNAKWDCGCNADCFCEANLIDNGWREVDAAAPQSFYSKSKYACDLAIGNLPNVCCLRIRMPISNRPNPRNLINKLLNYKNVLDEPNSVSFISDIVRLIDWVIENKKNGIYNATNPLPLTHPQLLEEYRKYRPEHIYTKINKEELNKYISTPRSNCILDTSKLQSEGFTMTNTQEALEKCIKEYCNG